MPSKLEFYVFPRLKSAQRQDSNTNHHDYKSGATFSGHLDGMKRVGHGTFLWPNGDRYTGEYADNRRQGKGEQTWADGARFIGHFVRDMRHGYGEHTWGDGESYKGDYFKDYRHGQGTYIWPDGSKFTGTFYQDAKEGYGVFISASGNKFEGLYKDGERLGPGVLTYTDGHQDVGLWHKERLVKLCTPIGDAFTMRDHPEFDYDPVEHQMTINMHQKGTAQLVNGLSLQSDGSGDATDSMRDTMERLSRTSFSTDFETFLPSRQESVDLLTLEYDKEEYDQAFFKKNSCPEGDGSTEVIALNNTPFFINIQRHVYKHRACKKEVSFSVMKILHGDRGKHGKVGPIEDNSQQLLQAAAAGDQHTVHSFLMQGASSANVADKQGHTALLGAAVNMHTDIINTILDNGANVNQLNDEGLSALVACHMLFYPTTSFQYNIAERYLPFPENEAIHSLTLCPIKPAMSERSGSAYSSKGGDSHSVASLKTKTRIEPSEECEDDDEEIDDGDHDDEDEVEDEGLDDRGPFEAPTGDNQEGDLGTRAEEDRIPSTVPRDFESDTTVVNYGIEVTEDLVERSATVLSHNRRIVSGRDSSCSEPNMDQARLRAIMKAEHANMEATIRLLLKRGADPNASSVPMPVIFFAIKAADVNAVQALLEKGAYTDIRLSHKKEGLAPLHIASAIRGEDGVQITRLLLGAGAHPNVRSQDNDLEHEEDILPGSANPVKIRPGLDESVSVLLHELEERGEHKGGRTPLHIACDRDDNDELARQVVHLLLEHGANPNVLCCGQSPLSLAIASGNDLAIDELLSYDANPSLPLGTGIGSALCVSANTAYEFRRTPQQRIALIDKLVKAGANILAPIQVGGKKVMGTAVDYAYWMFNQDRRIAHMPYHALTHSERDTYNARRKLLAHLGDILREAAVRRERERLEMEELGGVRSTSPSQGFLYTGAGAKPQQEGTSRPKTLRQGARGESPTPRSAEGGEGGKQVAFRSITKDSLGLEQPLVDKDDNGTVSDTTVLTVDVKGFNTQAVKRLLQTKKLRHRKPLFKYCYECGRCLGVRLSACTRCKEVYYCSKACKIKAWNARHKEECIRIGGRSSRSPSPISKTTTGAAGSGTNANHARPSDNTAAANVMTTGKWNLNGSAGRSGGQKPIKGQTSLSVKGQGGKSQPGATTKAQGSKGQDTILVLKGVNKGPGVKGTPAGSVSGGKGVVGGGSLSSKTSTGDEYNIKKDVTENYSFN
ncbi:ankyrin repeat and MYND domain-containing protein 1-like isoform X2 [Acanthaster planci]|uniref:Ankyrin repeat and MYND domain-containing protein 1-like isoform X2 n=1 Tax=Acanthaster planci TaxID=133434 RepID=A0A8B7YRC7_ACAPL|nr:ankyrin repeat and MYND domain-containing protein 1-like isoform X2 [Acanthaster planci]